MAPPTPPPNGYGAFPLRVYSISRSRSRSRSSSSSSNSGNYDSTSNFSNYYYNIT